VLDYALVKIGLIAADHCSVIAAGLVIIAAG